MTPAWQQCSVPTPTLPALCKTEVATIPALEWQFRLDESTGAEPIPVEAQQDEGWLLPLPRGTAPPASLPHLLGGPELPLFLLP